VRVQGQAKLPSKPAIDAGTRRTSVDNEFEMLRISDGPFHDDKIPGCLSGKGPREVGLQEA